MIDDSFQKYWQTNFSNCLPVSYLFKHNLNKLWLRIHSLPKSKRYAENEKEGKEIFRRQNILFNHIIGEDEECFAVCLGYEKNPTVIYEKKFPELANVLTKETKSIPLKEIEGEEGDDVFRVEFGKHKVKFKDFEKIFTAIANDEIHYFFLLNPKSKRIFAPYDGGVDLVLENSAKRDEFKEKYKNWISSRLDGL